MESRVAYRSKNAGKKDLPEAPEARIVTRALQGGRHRERGRHPDEA